MSTAANATGPWTVARLLAWTRDFLAGRGVESPRLCAEILLAHALGCERIKLFTQHETEPAPAVLARFRELVKQAAAHAPIAYLTGSKEFFSLTFEVTPAVLIPRPETEILVERSIHLVRQSGNAAARILDLCTGSGCIAVALARHLADAIIFASDVSAAALEVAQRNAARHGVAERIRFHAGDLLAPLAAEQFDLIVCNPPYVADSAALPANVRNHEPHVALFAGERGLNVIERLIADSPHFLADSGELLLEIAFDQAAPVRGLFEAGGWRDIRAYRDAGGHERVLHARRPAGAIAGEAQCTRPVRALAG